MAIPFKYPICKDCKHFKEGWPIFGVDQCTNKKLLFKHPITGKVYNRNAYDERSTSKVWSQCGYEGALFEQRPK